MKKENGKNKFDIKYQNGVTSYTMNKLLKIYDNTLDAQEEVAEDIFKAAAIGIITLLSTILPINMLMNKEIIKENLYKFLLFGIGVPTLGTTLTIKNIKAAIEDNKLLNDIINYFENYRKDIPISFIEKKYKEMLDEDTELNTMIDSSPEPKWTKKLSNIYFGDIDSTK